MSKPTRFGFSLIELLIVMAIIAVLCGMLLPAAQHVREASKRCECASHLQQLGLAFHVYHDCAGVFPFADYDKVSFYPQLLPYIEENHGPIPRPISLFFCPSRRGVESGPVADYAGILDAFGIMSVDAVAPVSVLQVSNRDGTGNTLMLSHKAMKPQDYHNPAEADWTQGAHGSAAHYFRSHVLAPPSQDGPGVYGKEFGGPHPDVLPCLYADGSVRSLKYNFTAGKLSVTETLRCLWDWDDGTLIEAP